MKTLKLLALLAFAAILVVPAAMARDLPEGWTRVAYVQGNPAELGRIKANYNLNPTGLKIVAEIEFTDVSKDMAVWCTRGEGWNKYSYSCFLSNGGLKFDYYIENGNSGNGATVSFAGGALTVGTKWTITADGKTMTVTDGNSTYSGTIPLERSSTYVGTLSLFASYYNGIDNNLADYANYRLYSLKDFRNGVLVHDLVPCLDDQGNATVYDVVDDSTAEFTVVGKLIPGKPVYESDFAAEVPEWVFDGTTPCEPHPVVTSKTSGEVLVEGTDYTLLWDDNDRVGDGAVIVTGQGAYAGQKAVFYFRITSPYGPGATFYVSPSGADDASCVNFANAGSLKCAMSKAAAENVSVVVLDSGDYDFTCEEATDGSFFEVRKQTTIGSRTGDPADCRLIGDGANRLLIVQVTTTLNLAGLTVTNFQATSSYGGAIYCKPGTGVSVTLGADNCVFSGNGARYGGAIYGGNNKGQLVDCAFIANVVDGGSATTDSQGGGISAFAGRIIGCLFERCQSIGHRGGAICGVPALISNCVFVANHAQRADHRYSGSAAGGGSFTFYNCVFSNNTANGGDLIRGNDGSGCVHKLYDCMLVGNCQFYDNSNFPDKMELCRCRVSKNTGAVCAGSRNENCLFVGNGRNDQSWTALHFLGGGEFFNCTIADTKSKLNGNQGGVFGSGARLVNCIVTADNQVNPTAASYTYYATNCVWNASGKDLLVGENNITDLANDAAIKFVGTGDDPYSIKLNSPARDKGVNVRGYTKADGDVIGNPRLSREGLLDIGCYEYQVTPGLMLLLR